MENSKTKPQKKNQLIWIERSEPEQGQPIMTVADEYKNIIAQVRRTYDKETKRFGYAVHDHEGKVMFTENNRGRIKQQLLQDKDRLLKEAHERRLEAIKSKSEKAEKSADTKEVKPEDRKEELSKIRQDQSDSRTPEQAKPGIEY